MKRNHPISAVLLIMVILLSGVTLVAQAKVQGGAVPVDLGTWMAELAKGTPTVTYRDDGKFEARVNEGGVEVVALGDYEFDGTTLTTYAKKFESSSTHAPTQRMVGIMNERIEQFPDSVIQRFEISFNGENQFRQRMMGNAAFDSFRRVQPVESPDSL